jgi:hypothetical protein
MGNASIVGAVVHVLCLHFVGAILTCLDHRGDVLMMHLHITRDGVAENGESVSASQSRF